MFKLTPEEVKIFDMTREPELKFVENFNEAVARGDGPLINHTLTDLCFHQTDKEKDRFDAIHGSNEKNIHDGYGISERGLNFEAMEAKILLTKITPSMLVEVLAHISPQSNDQQPEIQASKPRQALMLTVATPSGLKPKQREAPMIESIKAPEADKTSTQQDMGR